jgi:hypothetical protein
MIPYSFSGALQISGSGNAACGADAAEISGANQPPELSRT